MSDIRWTPSCGGNFFEGTACRTCTTCLNNLERIKAATGLVSGSEEDKELLRISRKNVDDWAREFQKERAKSLALREAVETVLIKALKNIAGPKRKDGTYFYSIRQIQQMGDDGVDTDTARLAIEKWTKALKAFDEGGDGTS